MEQQNGADMTPTEPKSDEEMAEEYASKEITTSAYSERGQVCMGFPAWHARQRNCLRRGYLAGMAAKEKQLGPRIREAEDVIRLAQRYCERGNVEGAGGEGGLSTIIVEYFAKHSKGDG